MPLPGGFGTDPRRAMPTGMYMLTFDSPGVHRYAPRQRASNDDCGTIVVFPHREAHRIVVREHAVDPPTITIARGDACTWEWDANDDERLENSGMRPYPTMAIVPTEPCPPYVAFLPDLIRNQLRFEIHASLSR